jgi:hypothetical protein
MSLNFFIWHLHQPEPTAATGGRTMQQRGINVWVDVIKRHNALAITATQGDASPPAFRVSDWIHNTIPD